MNVNPFPALSGVNGNVQKDSVSTTRWPPPCRHTHGDGMAAAKQQKNLHLGDLDPFFFFVLCDESHPKWLMTSHVKNLFKSSKKNKKVSPGVAAHHLATRREDVFINLFLQTFFVCEIDSSEKV